MKWGIVLSIYFLAGCATMFNGGVQSISVVSDKSVTVDIDVPDFNYNAPTPTVIKTTPSSSQDVRVTVNQDGYLRATTVVERSISPAYWFNALNVYGFIIDYFTGNMWVYEPVVRVPMIKIRPISQRSE